MTKLALTYLGNLRVSSIHLKSNSELINDSPIDNQGKGEAFSPTDTVASALASCMLTIMGIYANENNIDLSGTKAEVEKFMESNPRRIDCIKVKLIFNKKFDEKTTKKLERIGYTCPVYHSLHPDLKKEIIFEYA